MGNASGMIAQARKSLGTVEHPAGSNHNYITDYYNAHFAKIGNGAWCDMSISMWANLSDNLDAVGGAYAYTVWHAQKFQSMGRWHSGTSGIQAGDVLFYDWNGSRNIGAIDHVGLVEYVNGGVIHTIEGNRGDKCGRFIADKRFVVGYGRPKYTGVAKPAAVAPKEKLPDTISLGASQAVKAGVPCWIWWNTEYNDTGKQHSKNYPGAITNAKFVDLRASVHEVPGSFYFVAHNQKTGKDRTVDVGIHASGEVGVATDALYANEHLYIKFVPSADGTVKAWVKGMYWK